jgi:hypothetical protein
MKKHPLGAAMSVGTPIAKQVIAGVLTFFTLLAIATLVMHTS